MGRFSDDYYNGDPFGYYRSNRVTEEEREAYQRESVFRQSLLSEISTVDAEIREKQKRLDALRTTLRIYQEKTGKNPAYEETGSA